MDADAVLPADLIDHLHRVLEELSEHPYPFVLNPPSAPKRASVALILRVNPNFSRWPSPNSPPDRDPTTGCTTKRRLQAFFAQDWVRHGEPEVLFIKRSARKSDKWSGHIAFPGGKRDPEDVDDTAAAVRESAEEVGVDLGEDNAILVGNLAQRVVTSSWGRKALMVLCPYVFLLERHDQAPLRLQPTEVASAHWVSLRALLAPSQRTVESIDVAGRYSSDLRGWHNHFLLGEMLFAAVRLIPSQSAYSTVQHGFIPPVPTDASLVARTRRWLNGEPAHAPSIDRPLQLWGLTLGVMADFLDLLPASEPLRLWIFPTFTAYDVQFILWALSRRFRRQKSELLEGVVANRGSPMARAHRAGSKPMRNESFVQTVHDIQSESRSRTSADIAKSKDKDVRAERVYSSRSELLETMLEGYYGYISMSIKVTMLARVGALGGIAFWVWRKNRR